ncbi:MAG: hypothetical protein LBK61_00035 [Spirochaetaceae bacterium]|jgi:hypothetical protein|nr:hypothetical protein [Spirochaetaceae bacterium]
MSADYALVKNWYNGPLITQITTDYAWRDRKSAQSVDAGMDREVEESMNN